MITEDIGFSSSQDKQRRKYLENNSQFNNFNLNQNYKLSLIESSENLSTDKKTKRNYDQSNFERQTSNKKLNDKSLRSNPLDLLNPFLDEKNGSQKHCEKYGVKNANNSTLSLHISAYENANVVVGNNDKDNLQIEKQNPFKFPWQQKEDTTNKPEIMEFKASQKLLDTNKAESTASKDRGDESTDVHKGSDGYINPTDCESNSCEKISISEEEKQRLKNVIKFTRDSVKCFETNVSFHTLKLTTGICAEGIKEIEMYLVKNLGGQQSAGLLNIIAEIIHRVLNTIKLPENITKLGQNVVIDAVDTFIELIDEIMDKVRSYDFTPPWIHYCSLENLSIAFPVLMCIFRKQLNFTELQAHSKLFLFKGDLLRYRCNIENLPYGGACKAYWMAFSLLPGQGLVFNLLGVIAASRDINDRLSQIFYFMRAISTTTPFENAKIVLLAILEQISQKMIKTDFGQYHEIFKKPSMTDVTDKSSQIINPLNPNGSSFTWMPSTHDFETRSRNWKERLSRFSHSVIIKMITNSLFHMINLLITKSNSNSTLFTTCERFLALLSQILEREEISSRELLQLTTIFILALKSRDSFDESYQLLSRTFVHYTGLLFSRFYQVMIHRNSAPLSLLEQKGMIILPSLCCIESYWDSFEDKLSPVESCHFTCYNFFDFSIIRKNVKLLGHLLYFYIGNLNVSVKRAESDDVMENVYVLPEIILCCMGSRFPVKTDALQLNAIQEYSETFKTFLIRVLLAQELLAKMVKKEFFGINSFFEYSSGIHDQDTEISRHIYTLFESNNPHRRHPIHAQQNFPNVTPVYPVGVIPPYYISPQNGVWIKDDYE